VDGPDRGRLSAGRPPPGHAVDRPPAPGQRELRLDGAGRAWVRAPAGTGPQPLPLVVALHGAGGQAQGMLTMLTEAADRHGVLVLAPQSTRTSWDVVHGRYGPDVQLLDVALTQVFEDYAVDPAHLAVSGFSDGASYALSLGITNGDLFSHVIAWSPGFASPGVRHGGPRLFVSHGTRDEVLPVDRCSRRLVPALRTAGYAVDYHEFDGPHVVPADVIDRSLLWFLAAAEASSHSTAG
jgi:phospholipase/carboxylesterase